MPVVVTVEKPYYPDVSQRVLDKRERLASWIVCCKSNDYIALCIYDDRVSSKRSLCVILHVARIQSSIGNRSIDDLKYVT